MEKLFIKLIVFVACLQALQAQDSLCVYAIKGTVLKTVLSKKTPLSKGDVISALHKLTILPQSQLTAISKQGDLFVVDQEGKYTLKQLVAFKQKREEKNVSALYFKFLWAELTHHTEKKTVIAGVFRGNVLMQSPIDSAIITHSRIALEWQKDDHDALYYVFLRNKKTGIIHKFETNGSHLVFYPQNPIFEGSTAFEWAATTEAFPKVNNMPFYTFTLLDREAYEQQKMKYQALITEMKALDYNDLDIDKALCAIYKLCK